MLPLCLSCSCDDGWFAGRRQMEVGGVALSPWTWRAPEEAHVVRWSQLKRKNLRRSFDCGTEPCLRGLCIRSLLSDAPIRTCHMQDKTFCPQINREPPKWLYHPGRLEQTQSFVLSQIISHRFPQKTSYFLMRLCSCESITCIKRLCSAIFGERWPDFMCSSVITCRQTGVRAATSLKKRERLREISWRGGDTIVFIIIVVVIAAGKELISWIWSDSWSVGLLESWISREEDPLWVVRKNRANNQIQADQQQGQRQRTDHNNTHNTVWISGSFTGACLFF